MRCPCLVATARALSDIGRGPLLPHLLASGLGRAIGCRTPTRRAWPTGTPATRAPATGVAAVTGLLNFAAQLHLQTQNLEEGLLKLRQVLLDGLKYGQLGPQEEGPVFKLGRLTQGKLGTGKGGRHLGHYIGPGVRHHIDRVFTGHRTRWALRRGSLLPDLGGLGALGRLVGLGRLLGPTEWWNAPAC